MLFVYGAADEQVARDLIHAHVPSRHGTAVCRIGGNVAVVVPEDAIELAAALQGSLTEQRTGMTRSAAALSDRALAPFGSVVPLGDRATVGGADFALIAGPCAVESDQQLADSASIALRGGAVALRGGAFKPRSSPYSFQGLGADGLRMLAAVRAESGLPVVTEVVDIRTLDLVAEYADVLQIGTRNAQNFPLIQAAGRTGKPILLKRGFGCTVGEWLQAAEYVLAEGNPNVILCERGIRSFESSTRFTLDLSAVAVVKHTSHLPIIVDPSHGVGHRHLIKPMALAAAAAGADGLMVDIHPDPQAAQCDGNQALTEQEWLDLSSALQGVLAGLGRPSPTVEPVGAGRP